MVKQINWNNIIDLLINAKRQVILIMPSIHEEWVDAIEKIDDTSNPVDIKICINNSETSIRNGYGSIKSLDRLRENYYEINECENLRINFISVDDISFCLFLESRILAGNPNGYNAIELSISAANEIINQFFPINHADNPTVILSKALDEQKFLEVKLELKRNPPVEPDLQRQINTYRTHFQYADIHFENGHLQNKTISIPKDALPFKNTELKARMKTSFNLFEKAEYEKWLNLKDIHNEIENIRKEFLHPCSLKRGRNILKKADKQAYLKRIEALKKLIEKNRNEMLESVQKSLFKSKDLLEKELTQFFEINPPDYVINLKDDDLKKRMTRDITRDIIQKTKIPNANTLLGKMLIDDQYAEFTEEDLDNEKFLNWFKDKKLIDSGIEGQIAKFEKAYRIKI